MVFIWKGGDVLEELIYLQESELISATMMKVFLNWNLNDGTMSKF